MIFFFLIQPVSSWITSVRDSWICGDAYRFRESCELLTHEYFFCNSTRKLMDHISSWFINLLWLISIARIIWARELVHIFSLIQCVSSWITSFRDSNVATHIDYIICCDSYRFREKCESSWLIDILFFNSTCKFMNHITSGLINILWLISIARIMWARVLVRFVLIQHVSSWSTSVRDSSKWWLMSIARIMWARDSYIFCDSFWLPSEHIHTYMYSTCDFVNNVSSWLRYMLWLISIAVCPQNMFISISVWYVISWIIYSSWLIYVCYEISGSCVYTYNV